MEWTVCVECVECVERVEVGLSKLGIPRPIPQGARRGCRVVWGRRVGERESVEKWIECEKKSGAGEGETG